MGAGGADTARGISFQHAEAVGACLDLLESAEATKLQVEGHEDVVDFELRRDDGERLRVCQAKTRKEPYTWGPAEIVSIIQSWLPLDKATEAQFEFLTDGSAGPEVADRLRPALTRARTGRLTTEDEQYLASKGLTADETALQRVTIATRQPSADALLDRATVRIIRLLEMVGSASAEQAEALVNELFRLVSLRAGQTNPDDRIIRRGELADLVGVPLDVIDSGQLWDSAVRETYIQRLREQPPHPSFVALEAEPLNLEPDAFALVVREQAEPAATQFTMPAAEVLAAEKGAVLSGPAGAGKTTTLELLVHAAVDRGLCPVLLSVEQFEAGSLPRLIRGALERHLPQRLAPGATDAFLNSEGATVLLDGAGELDAEARQALLGEVSNLGRNQPGVRVILTSRSPTRLRSLGLPSFILQGVDAGLRRRIAAGLIDGNQEDLVRDVERRLGDIVDNPLLFVMALSLARRGVQAESRTELLDAFMDGLAARAPEGALGEVVLAAVREACFVLRVGDAYSVDRWTWMRLIASALERLTEQRLFGAEATNADDILQQAQAGGLVRELPSSGSLALTHDLFCDYLAAEAVRLDQQELPEQLGESLEEVAVFLAERGDLSHRAGQSLATNPVAAARGGAASPATGGLDDAEVTELYGTLSGHLGMELRETLSGTEVRTAELSDGVYLFVLDQQALPESSPLDPDAAADAAHRVVRLPPGATSLTGAVALWLAEIRWALKAKGDTEPLPVPAERENLPSALEAAFHARMQCFETLLEEVCPPLAERARREFGLRGFHAEVLPSVSHTLPIGGGQDMTFHPLVFSFNAPDVEVRLADEADAAFIGDPSTETASEDWLREAPLDAALKDVRKALSDLLPGVAR